MSVFMKQTAGPQKGMQNARIKILVKDDPSKATKQKLISENCRLGFLSLFMRDNEVQHLLRPLAPV